MTSFCFWVEDPLRQRLSLGCEDCVSLQYEQELAKACLCQPFEGTSNASKQPNKPTKPTKKANPLCKSLQEDGIFQHWCWWHLWSKWQATLNRQDFPGQDLRPGDVRKTYWGLMGRTADERFRAAGFWMGNRFRRKCFCCWCCHFNKCFWTPSYILLICKLVGFDSPTVIGTSESGHPQPAY